MNINDIPDAMMNKIKYYLSDLGNLAVKGYKIKNINFIDKEINFLHQNSLNECRINFDDNVNTQMANINTSDLNTEQILHTDNFSDTSDDEVININKNQNGGNKNIFQSLKHSSKYSETSSAKFDTPTNDSKTSSTNLHIKSNFSDTSDISNVKTTDTYKGPLIYNKRSDNYSDTSDIKTIENNKTHSDNYSDTSDLKSYNMKSDNCSNTSELTPHKIYTGGVMNEQTENMFEDLTDTLRSISELQNRKQKSIFKSTPKPSSSTFQTNYDMGIFKQIYLQNKTKIGGTQTGGSKSNNELKKKMLEMGIHSSSSTSTSSICE